MKRQFVTGLLMAIPLLGVLGSESQSKADEVTLTGPLKGAPAVRRLRLYRQGRFEIDPTVSFSLLDEYRRSIMPGVRLTYNFTDWFSFGVWGAAGAISMTTALTDEIDQVAPRSDITAANVAPNGPNITGHAGQPTFTDQTAKLSYIAMPQFTFTPFRGKLALFQKLFVDTDFYISAGLGAVGLQERAYCGASGQPSCTSPQSFNLASQTKIAPSVGLGLTFYPGDWFSFGVEYRALLFSWNQGGFDTRGSGNNNNFPDGKVDSQDDIGTLNQFVTVFIGFSLPTAPKISE